MPMDLRLMRPGLSRFASITASPLYRNATTDLVLGIVPAWTYNNSAEVISGSVQGKTRTETDGDLFGNGVSYGPNSHIVTAMSTSTRPTLQSGSGQSSWFRFNGSHAIWVENWAGAFSFLHTTGVFYIGTCLRPTSFAATQVLMENNNNTTASAGISVRITTSGTINVFVNNGTAGQQNWNLTSTAALTLNAANYVQIYCDGTTLTIDINGSTRTQTKSNAFGSATPPFALTIGRSNAATNNLTTDVAWLVIYKSVPSASVRSQYMSWKPARTSTNPYPGLSGGDLFTAWAWGLWRCFDTAYVYKDTSLTTNVSATNDNVQLLRHYWAAQMGLSLNRHIIKNGTNDPCWESSPGLANFGAVRFGVTGNLSTADGTNSLRIGSGGGIFPIMPHPLNWTRIVIWRNRGATTTTSHILVGVSSSTYMVVTDDGYTGGGDNPRVVAHDSLGSGISSGNAYTRLNTKFNMIELSCTGTSHELFLNGNQDPATPYIADSTFPYDRVGGGGITTFYGKGSLAFIGVYPWKFSAAERAAAVTYAESYLGYSA